MAYDLKAVRAEFPFFAHNPGVVYLDSAATALKPQCVLDATHAYYAYASVNPHNVDSPFADSVHAQLTEARRTAGRFMGVGPDETLFSSGATDSLNIFASGLDGYVRPGDEIVVPVLEHTSNLLPWLMLARRTGAKLAAVEQAVGETLAAALIKRVTQKTRVAAFTAVSNLFGTQTDFVALARRVKEVAPDACVVVDATQAAPHGQFDLSGGHVDLLAFSAHKVFGPTGVGVAYVSKRAQTFLSPARYGGGMSAGFDLGALTIKYRAFPECYEAGTPNAAGILAAAEGLRFFSRIGPREAARHENAMARLMIDGLKGVAGVRVLNDDPAAPIAAFNVDGWHPQDVARCLGQKNIVVRAGTSCVDAIKRLPPGKNAYVRASAAPYTSPEEAEALVSAVRGLRKEDAFAGLVG